MISRRLPLNDGGVDERDQPHVGVADRHDRFHVGEQPHVARRAGRRRAVVGRPPHLGGASRVAASPRRRAAVRGRAAQDESGRDVHVGLIARHVDRRGDAAGRRGRQDEGAPPGVSDQRGADLERRREGAGPGEQRDVGRRLPRSRGSGRLSIRASSSVASLISGTLHAGAEDLAVDAASSRARMAPATRTRMSARVERGGTGRCRTGGRAGGQIEHPIVVGARHRDGAGAPCGISLVLRGAGDSKRDRRPANDRQHAGVTSAASDRAIRRSRAGSCVSGVSSAARNTDGPIAGNVIATGTTPCRLRPASFLNWSSSV